VLKTVTLLIIFNKRKLNPVLGIPHQSLRKMKQCMDYYDRNKIFILIAGQACSYGVLINKFGGNKLKNDLFLH